MQGRLSANRRSLLQHRMRWIALLMLSIGIGLGTWWYWQPPEPSVVAVRVMQAIRKNDAKQLYQFTCTEERERITLEQLQRILNIIHQRFPELGQSTEVPVAYRPSGLAKIVPTDYQFVFFFKHFPEKNQMIACSTEEVESLGKQLLQSRRLPKGHIRLVLSVSSLAQGRHRCALVMEGLILCVISLSLSRNLSDEEIMQHINEIFQANGVHVVLSNSHAGTMKRIDKIKLFRYQNENRGFEW